MHTKKTFVSAIIFFCFIYVTNAQMTLNPSHQFYEDALNWQVKGYVEKLPPVRPYSFTNVKEILENILEKGNSSDVKKAQDYYEELTGKPWQLELDVSVDVKNDTQMPRIHPMISGDLPLFDEKLGIGYKLGWDIRTKFNETEVLPAYSFPKYDSIQDPATIGPFLAFLDSDVLFSYGTSNLFIQFGLNRFGYGNFINTNITKNEASYHSGNIAFTYMNDFITYSQVLSTIGASKNYDGSGLAPDKFFAMHLIQFNFTKNLDFTYYENMVFGKRFDPIYLIPAPYMACQGLNGCNDNLQMGIAINYHFLNQFAIKFNMMIDDIDFNRAVKFDFDSKNRIAAQLGFEYVPNSKFLDFVELNYTAITPYTYSHWEDPEPGKHTDENSINYQNYTNSGIKMGSQLNPNSDSISLKAKFTPIRNLQIITAFDFIRHGNISESINDQEAFKYLAAKAGVNSTDGSLNVNSKLNDECLETAWVQLNFLNQEHLMYIIRPSLEVNYSLPTIFKKLHTKIGLKYTFEYITNYGINSNMFPGGEIKDNDGSTFDWRDSTYTYNDENDIKSIVETYRNDWISNLKTKTNHIISIDCTLTW